MKIWIKLGLGAAIGFTLGFLLPQDNPFIQSTLEWLETMVIKIGRYSLTPLIFFSLAISVFELRQAKKMWGIILMSLALIAAPAILLPAIGLAAVIAFPPARIPILIEGETINYALDPIGAAEALVPTNAFAALGGDGDYLLPLALLAFFLGAGLSYDRSHAKPISALIDSLSRIFYYVSAFFSEVIGIGMIALGAYWAVRYRAALDAEVFRDIFSLLTILAIVIGFIILPTLLYLFGIKTNPWKQLYGCIGPAIAAWFSGDILFSLPLAFRHAKENHGVKRKVNTLSFLAHSAFGRSGSAMVAAVSLIIIIKSYSSLGVTLSDLVFILLHAGLLSFLLVRFPGVGAFAALAILCAWFGRGFEAGYLILKPIAFYLISVGAFLDIMVASLATFALGKISGFQEEREARHFI